MIQAIILDIVAGCRRILHVLLHCLAQPCYYVWSNSKIPLERYMPYSPEQMHELDVLIRYSLDTGLRGIKVHKNANPEFIEAVKRLYQKGLLTQQDGGYLTDLGRSAAEHAQALMLILAPHCIAS